MASNHNCTQQEKIGALMRVCETDIPEMKSTLNKIFDRLEGTNGNGLVTKVALNHAAIGRMWWWIGGVALVVGGAAIKEFLFK